MTIFRLLILKSIINHNKINFVKGIICYFCISFWKKKLEENENLELRWEMSSRNRRQHSNDQKNNDKSSAITLPNPTPLRKRRKW